LCATVPTTRKDIMKDRIGQACSEIR